MADFSNSGDSSPRPVPNVVIARALASRTAAACGVRRLASAGPVVAG